MTVGELRAILDDYGDHVDIIVQHHILAEDQPLDITSTNSNISGLILWVDDKK